jgi:hypothetical protein
MLTRSVVVVVLAAVGALLVGFRPTLAPPGLHTRGEPYAVAEGRMLIDSRSSVLRSAEGSVTEPAAAAFTYVRFLQTDEARRAIGIAAGIDPRRLAASGPFTALLNRSNESGGKRAPPKLQSRDRYSLLLDVSEYLPVMTVYASAPHPEQARAIVEAARDFLSGRVERLLAAAPTDSPAVVSSLGPVTGGTVAASPAWALSGVTFAVLAGIGLWLVWRRRLSLADDLPAAPAAAADDWPHTTRVLPWMVAAFMVLVWVVPFEALSLPGPADRPLLVAFVLVWIMSMLAVRGAARPRLRLTGVHLAALALLLVAAASAVLNAEALANLHEIGLVLKKIGLLGTLLLFLMLVGSSVRAAEVPRLITLMLWLAAIAAIGTIVEYRLHYNVFYELLHTLAPSRVAVPPDLDGLDSIGRLNILGPTGHPLEIATLLGMALPFSLLRLMDGSEWRQRLIYGALAALLIAGAVSTGRKTCVVAPVAAILVLLAYRPRALLRVGLPLIVGLGLLVHVLAPGASGSVLSQLEPGRLTGALSTRDRTSDYAGVRPDVVGHLLVGRGYESYDHVKYRILDNQYLGLIVGVGLLGVVAYAALILGAMGSALRLVRLGDPVRGPPALGLAAALAVLLVAGGLFDVLSFPHVPYLAFLLIGLVVALGEPQPVSRRAPTPAWKPSRDADRARAGMVHA